MSRRTHGCFSRSSMNAVLNVSTSSRAPVLSPPMEPETNCRAWSNSTVEFL